MSIHDEDNNMLKKALAATSTRQVRLLELPDGKLSSQYKMTVDAIYEVLGSMGSCLVVSTDVAGKTASIWRGRFSAVA